MSRAPKLLVIDDGERYVELFHALLRDYRYATRCELPGPCWECERRPGCELTHAHDAQQAQEALRRHPDVDVVLLDVAFDLPEARLLPAKVVDARRRRSLQGVEILAQIRRGRGELPVVLMTSEAQLGFEEAAMALAVDEFVTLAGADAFDARALGLLVERILARRRMAPEVGGYGWGNTAAMARVRRDAAVLARTSLPMLLLGETGTGKSALAERVVHPTTGRAGPFVAVDLSALPENLVASELFGSARGAFSGAVDRPGRFEQADGGTLFLDEIGNLPLDAQRLLLLVLQDRRVTRLGDGTPRSVDVKVVAATHCDLEQRVRDGRFRADLYARLNPAASLTLPPLRDRRADLRELAEGFVRKTFATGADRALLADYMEAASLEGSPRASLQVGGPPVEPRGVAFVLSAKSLAEMRSYGWPMNVRELELFVANATVFALADALGALEQGRGGGRARTIPIPDKLVRDLLAGHTVEPESARAGDFEVRPRAQLRDVARDLERQLFERLYRETNGDFDRMAARLLEGGDEGAARRVRLRFNQLGLRVKALRGKA